MPVDLTGLAPDVKKIIESQIAGYIDLTTDLVQRRLTLIAEEMVRYWELARYGDEEAEENLRYLKSEADLLVLKTRIEGVRAARQQMERVLTLLAKIGLSIIGAAV